MREEPNNTSETQSRAAEAPTRYAGQPVPIGRSPWTQPPSKLVAQAASTEFAPPLAEPVAAGVYRIGGALSSPQQSLSRDFGGVRQVTVANPAPCSGKTATVDALHAAFREVRADVVAWDCAGLTDDEFGRERDRLSRTYRLLIVDTACDPMAALDATDALVVPVSGRPESLRAAQVLLAELEASDQAAIARNAVVIVEASKPDGETTSAERHASATAERFAGRTRAVFIGVDAKRIAQAVADGL